MESHLLSLATAAVNLQCVSSIGDAAASVECEADFELVSIQCVIDDGAPQSCKFLFIINQSEKYSSLIYSFFSLYKLRIANFNFLYK